MRSMRSRIMIYPKLDVGEKQLLVNPHPHPSSEVVRKGGFVAADHQIGISDPLICGV